MNGDPCLLSLRDHEFPDCTLFGNTMLDAPLTKMLNMFGQSTKEQSFRDHASRACGKRRRRRVRFEHEEPEGQEQMHVRADAHLGRRLISLRQSLRRRGICSGRRVFQGFFLVVPVIPRALEFKPPLQQRGRMSSECSHCLPKDVPPNRVLATLLGLRNLWFFWFRQTNRTLRKAKSYLSSQPGSTSWIGLLGDPWKRVHQNVSRVTCQRFPTRRPCNGFEGSIYNRSPPMSTYFRVLHQYRANISQPVEILI